MVGHINDSLVSNAPPSMQAQKRRRSEGSVIRADAVSCPAQQHEDAILKLGTASGYVLKVEARESRQLIISPRQDENDSERY